MDTMSKPWAPPPVKVTLPTAWEVCPVCGLHYTTRGHSIDKRRCTWFLEQQDQN